jgi:hypothetical protein
VELHYANRPGRVTAQMHILEVYLTFGQEATFKTAALCPTNFCLLFQSSRHPLIVGCSLHQSLSPKRSALRL